jgi:hypothetical protein
MVVPGRYSPGHWTGPAQRVPRSSLIPLARAQEPRPDLYGAPTPRRHGRHLVVLLANLNRRRPSDRLLVSEARARDTQLEPWPMQARTRRRTFAPSGGSEIGGQACPAAPIYALIRPRRENRASNPYRFGHLAGGGTLIRTTNSATIGGRYEMPPMFGTVRNGPTPAHQL